LGGVFSTPLAFFSGLAFFKRKCLSKIDLSRVDYDLQYTSHTIIVLYYIYFLSSVLDALEESLEVLSMTTLNKCRWFLLLCESCGFYSFFLFDIHVCHYLSIQSFAANFNDGGPVDDYGLRKYRYPQCK